MFGELIRKDLRVCRLPIVAGVALLLAPFAVAGIVVPRMPLWSESTPGSAWAVLLGTGCHFSLMCSLPTLAMIAGSIIAAERSDRSAEFLACLPLSKRRILSSKFAVLLGAAAVIWGGYFAVRLLAEWLAGDTQAAETLTANMALTDSLAAIGLLAAGTGWCGSALLSSTGPAVAMAFVSPLVVQGGLALTQYLTGWPADIDYARVYFTTCAATGITMFLTGTAYFLHRVEP